MPFSNDEKINNSDKLSLGILGTANNPPGQKWWYNETQSWNPIIPPSRIWKDFSLIGYAANSAGADLNVTNNPTIIEKSICKVTLDITSGNRAYLPYLTFNDKSSAFLDNWLMPSLFKNSNSDISNGYIVRLYNGNPSSGGTEITTTYHSGSGGSPAWSFNYSNGLLLISSDEATHFKSLYDNGGLWIVGYRYIGEFGLSGGGSSGPEYDITTAFGKEQVAKTIYISPTGNDETGTGTVSLPYFSLHKAISTINTIVDAVITIQAAAGTYNYNTYGGLFFNRFLMTSLGSIKITSGIDILTHASSLVGSGTFTNHSLLTKGAGASDLSSRGLVHNQNGASFTLNAYEGMLLKVTGMQNGHSLPGLAYRSLPILENGIDWIETAPAYSSPNVLPLTPPVQQYQDISTYEIRNHVVVFDFGSVTGNKIIGAATGVIEFNSVKILNVSSVHTVNIEQALNSALGIRFINCNVTYKTGSSNKDYSASSLYQQCYVNFGESSGNQIATIQGCAIKSTMVIGGASSTVGKDVSTPINLNGTFTGNNMKCNGTEFAVMLQGNKTLAATGRVGLRDINKVTGTALGVFSKNPTVTMFNCGGTWIIDTNCKFFLKIAKQSNQNLIAGIFDSNFPLVFLPNEPTTGRATHDGTTDLANYFNLEIGYNLLAIAIPARRWNPNDFFRAKREDSFIITATDITNGYVSVVQNPISIDAVYVNGVKEITSFLTISGKQFRFNPVDMILGDILDIVYNY